MIFCFNVSNIYSETISDISDNFNNVCLWAQIILFPLFIGRVPPALSGDLHDPFMPWLNECVFQHFRLRKKTLDIESDEQKINNQQTKSK